MKRFAMLALVAALFAGIVVGCGGGDKDKKKDGDNKAGKTENTAPANE